MVNLYRVKGRTRLGRTGHPESRNVEEIVWASRESPCRESERRRGVRRAKSEGERSGSLRGQKGEWTHGENQTKPRDLGENKRWSKQWAEPIVGTREDLTLLSDPLHGDFLYLQSISSSFLYWLARSS
jgi:hypothetical protein